MSDDPFNSIRPLEVDGTSVGSIYSLPALEETGLGNISRLPVSIRIVLESRLHKRSL